MAQNHETSQFKAVLQSYLPERRLVRQRNAHALFFKAMRNHHEALYGRAITLDLLLAADSINMDLKGMLGRPNSDEHVFQSMRLRRAIGSDEGYLFADPVLNGSRLELHTKAASAKNVRQLVTDLGAIASHLAQPEDEC